MKTESFHLVKDTLIYFISLAVVLIPFYVFIIIGRIEYDRSTQILFLYAGLISFPVIKGFYSAIVDLVVPHVRIEDDALFVRPPGKLGGVSFKWEEVLSVVGIMDGLKLNELPVYYDVKNKDGEFYNVYSCGMLKRKRQQLDESLRKKIRARIPGE